MSRKEKYERNLRLDSGNTGWDKWSAPSVFKEIAKDYVENDGKKYKIRTATKNETSNLDGKRRKKKVIIHNPILFIALPHKSGGAAGDSIGRAMLGKDKQPKSYAIELYDSEGELFKTHTLKTQTTKKDIEDALKEAIKEAKKKYNKKKDKLAESFETYLKLTSFSLTEEIISILEETSTEVEEEADEDVDKTDELLEGILSEAGLEAFDSSDTDKKLARIAKAYVKANGDKIKVRTAAKGEEQGEDLKRRLKKVVSGSVISMAIDSVERRKDGSQEEQKYVTVEIISEGEVVKAYVIRTYATQSELEKNIKAAIRFEEKKRGRKKGKFKKKVEESLNLPDYLSEAIYIIYEEVEKEAENEEEQENNEEDKVTEEEETTDDVVSEILDLLQ